MAETTEQQTDLGWTKKVQQQEPGLPEEECFAPDWCRCEECWNEAYDMDELAEDDE